MEFTGKFETHITVCLDDLKKIEVLQKWSANNGFKFLHIMLDRGVTASQPMLTRYGWGNLTNELNIAVKLSESLKKRGLSVLRTKIEAAPENQGIPQSNSEALNHSLDQYFEHHIKLLLEPSVDLVQLRKLAEQHSAHLSRNVLKTRSDNYQERFITQRCMTVASLPFDLLYLVLVSNQDWISKIDRDNFSWRSGFPWTMSKISELDWSYLKREYPWVEGEGKDWQGRLSQALAPTFANLDDSMYPISSYQYW